MTKTKLTVAVVIGAVAVLCFASGATAAKKGANGMDLFKEYCKPCHGPNSENGEVTPMTLIQEQWEKFFNEDFAETHKSVNDPNHGDKPVTEVLSDDDIEVLSKWTISHAADSEQPMTCG